MHFDTFRLNGVGLSRIWTAGGTFRRLQVPSSEAVVALLQVIGSGEMTFPRGAPRLPATVKVRENNALFFRDAAEVEYRTASDSARYEITLPERWAGHPDQIELVKSGPAGPVIVSAMNAIFNNGEELTAPATLHLTQAIRELVAAVRIDDMHPASPVTRGKSEIFRRAMSHIYDNWANPDFHVGELARMTKVSERYLRASFSAFGKSPFQMLARIRARGAEGVIRTTPDPLVMYDDRFARTVGYSSVRALRLAMKRMDLDAD